MRIRRPHQLRFCDVLGRSSSPSAALPPQALPQPVGKVKGRQAGRLFAKSLPRRFPSCTCHQQDLGCSQLPQGRLWLRAQTHEKNVSSEQQAMQAHLPIALSTMQSIDPAAHIAPQLPSSRATGTAPRSISIFVQQRAPMSILKSQQQQPQNT